MLLVMFCVLVSFLIAHWLWWGCCVWWLLSGVYSFTMICGLYVARTFFGCFDCFAGVLDWCTAWVLGCY